MSGENDDDNLPQGKRPTVGDRVRLLERDVRGHSEALTGIVKVVAVHGADIKKLEEWQMTRLLAEAREEERDKSLYGRLDRIDESIKAMRGFWMRIAWIAAVPIIGATVGGVALMIVRVGNLG